MWTSSEPQCEIVNCGPVTVPVLNGQVDTSFGTTFGSVATFSCNTGYMLSHQQVVMCGADGMWSPASPSCDAVNCVPLTNPANGHVDTSSGTTFESTATYTCDTGYTLSGSQSRTCGADKMWTLSEPTCEVVDCRPLANPINGQVDTSSGTTFGSTATYTCDTGYTLSGSQSRTCGADGMWSSSDPTCEIVNCGPLTDPDNGQVDTSSGTTFGSVATFSCNTGYMLSHQQMVMCGADGMWSPPSLSCDAVNCGPLTNPDNGQVYTSSGTTFGSTATYTCDTGYTLSGSQSRTCGANGNWTFSMPVCDGATPTDNIPQPTPLSTPTLLSPLTSLPLVYSSESMFVFPTSQKLTTAKTAVLSPSSSRAVHQPATPKASLFIQIRLKNIASCQEYTSSGVQLKKQNIIDQLVENVRRLCTCDSTTFKFTQSYLRCFDQSPDIVTFRAEISAVNTIKKSDLVSYIEQWIESTGGLVVDGLYLTFVRDCPLVIENLHSDECTKNEEEANTSGQAVGGVVGGVVVLLIVAVVIAITVSCLVYKHKRKKQAERMEILHYEVMRPPIPTPDADHIHEKRYETIGRPPISTPSDDADPTYERVVDLQLNIKKLDLEKAEDMNNDKECVGKYYEFVRSSTPESVYVSAPSRKISVTSL